MAHAAYLHDAVGAGVVVDQRALAGRPHEDQQVGLAVAVVDKVARVVALQVGVGVVGPLDVDGAVGGHSALEIVDVDVRAVYARRRAQDGVDVGDEAREGRGRRRIVALADGAGRQRALGIDLDKFVAVELDGGHCACGCCESCVGFV